MLTNTFSPDSSSSSTPIFQVHEFNEAVNFHLQRLSPVIVEGEISQLQISQGKWLFLTIKDEQASVSVFAPLFKVPSARIFEEGMKVHVYGQAGLYQKTGRFSLNATQIVPAGEGALRLAYEKLKVQLEAEGLFELARKRALPPFPQRIGLITATDSRAYSDFVKILNERMGGLKIYFYPVQVQGMQSVASLLQAFTYFNDQAEVLQLDALVLTRGGGSLEDLLAFNDEQVARAVFASKIPVISGIGHEADVALTDLVADVRASTPSNAAQLLVPTREEVAGQIEHLVFKLNKLVHESIIQASEIVADQVQALQQVFSQKQQQWQRLVASLKQQIFFSLQARQKQQQMFETLSIQLSKKVDQHLLNYGQKVQQLSRLLGNFDMQKILQRGFSISRLGTTIIKSSQQVKPGDQVITQVAAGQFSAKVVSS